MSANELISNFLDNDCEIPHDNFYDGWVSSLSEAYAESPERFSAALMVIGNLEKHKFDKQVLARTLEALTNDCDSPNHVLLAVSMLENIAYEETIGYDDTKLAAIDRAINQSREAMEECSVELLPDSSVSAVVNKPKSFRDSVRRGDVEEGPGKTFPSIG